MDHLPSSELCGDSDNDLVTRIGAGDEQALSCLVRRYSDILYRLAYLRIQDQDTAKDIVQDLFISIWEKRDGLVIHGDVKHYLLRAARNRALNMIQHENAKRRLEAVLAENARLNDHSTTPDENLELEELIVTIRAVLDSLPPRTREVFLLRRDEGMSYEAIATVLGIGIPTVHNQMSRAVRTVSSALEKWRRSAEQEDSRSGKNKK